MRTAFFCFKSHRLSHCFNQPLFKFVLVDLHFHRCTLLLYPHAVCALRKSCWCKISGVFQLRRMPARWIAAFLASLSVAKEQDIPLLRPRYAVRQKNDWLPDLLRKLLLKLFSIAVTQRDCAFQQNHFLFSSTSSGGRLNENSLRFPTNLGSVHLIPAIFMPHFGQCPHAPRAPLGSGPGPFSFAYHGSPFGPRSS